MIRWDALLALCGHLRAGLLDGGRRRRPRDASWERLIAVAGQEFVTPALAWCLSGRTGVPPLVDDYLARILALNAARNGVHLDALAEIAGALNAVGVEPVLLKGAARLVEGCYPAPSLRFLGDLDVLVPADAAAEAARALKAVGYGEANSAQPLPPDHHHLPPLVHPVSGAVVELHTAVTSRPCEAVLPTDWFLRGTMPFDLRGRRVRLADATRSVAHVVVHDQLQHGRHARDRVELRQLLDVAVLRERRGEPVDWTEIDGRFRGDGQGPALMGILGAARLLFGQAIPPVASEARPGAARRFSRAYDPTGVRSRSTVTLELDAGGFQPGGGHCWLTALPPHLCPGDRPRNPNCSVLDLREDGRALGPAHTAHDEIRAEGRGRFSHWGNCLYLSSSDGSDPRNSGRRYSIAAAVSARALGCRTAAAP